MISIVIPTCKPQDDIRNMLVDIETNTLEWHKVIHTCLPLPAARNRNIAHASVRREVQFVVSLDDDIQGFYPGWLTDIIQPLKEDETIRFASARLMKPGGREVNFMMTSSFDLKNKYEDVPRCPTSAYAYRKKDFDSLFEFYNKDSLPFDENFKGSGWEDNALCHDLKMRFPDSRIIINNQCKLIHVNEEKNQKQFLQENKKYFFSSGRTEK